MKSASGQGKTRQGGTEEKISLSKRDLLDLELVRRRIYGSLYEDDAATLFVFLRPVEAQFVLSTLDRVIGELRGEKS